MEKKAKLENKKRLKSHPPQVEPESKGSRNGKTGAFENRAAATNP